MPRPVRSSRRRIKRAARPRLAAILSVGKPRRKLATEEHDAQVELFRDHIATRLHPDAVAFAIPNGGFRNKTVALQLRDEGATSGVPDVFAIRDRQAYFLEMKKPKRKGGGRSGTVSKAQREMMARLELAGACCAVAHGVDEAVAQLEVWGLLIPITATRQEKMAA